MNGRKSYVVKGGHLKEEEWSDVRVGDTIRMVSNQFVAVSFSTFLKVNWDNYFVKVIFFNL